MSRRILALDQSSHISGYAVFIDGKLETYGHFTIKDEDTGLRLLKIRQQVEQLVDQYDITEAIIEDIQLQTNVTNNVATFKILAEVYGVIYELLTEKDIKFTSVLASSWKSKLKIKSKQRQQQKQEAQELVSTIYGKKATQDESDAICIGMYYLISNNLPKEDIEKDYDWSE